MSDIPLVGQTYKGVDIPTIQARADQVLVDAFRGREITHPDVGAKEAKLDGMLDEASRLIEMLREKLEIASTLEKII